MNARHEQKAKQADVPATPLGQFLLKSYAYKDNTLAVFV